MAKLAINLTDLDRLEPTFRQKMLGRKLDLSRVVKVNNRGLIEPGVVFTCPILEAALICDIIRNNDRLCGDPPTRAYIFRQDWKRLRDTDVLTQVHEGKANLAPAIFTDAEIIIAPPIVQAPKRLAFGKRL